MKCVVLTAITKEGADALRLLKAKIHVSRRERFIYGRMYSETVISEEPFSFKITPKHAMRAVALHVQLDHVLRELELNIQNARRGVDYELEGE